MSKIELGDTGSRVLKRKHRTVDLTIAEYRKFCDALFESFKTAAYFEPEKVLAQSDKYREKMIPVYEFCGRYAHIAFEKEFDPRLMSKFKIEEATPADGIVSISFDYYSSLKETRYRITFRAPDAPITKTWPEAIVKSGGHESIIEKFKTV